MWRHLSRNVLRRSNCFDKPDSCVNKGREKKHSSKSSCTVVNKILPVTYFSQKFSNCVFDYNSNKRKKEKFHENTTENINQYTFFEAFGWSGAVVFGWAISKHIWLKHTWIRDEENNQKVGCLLNNSLIKLLSQVVKTQPPVKFVLPQLKPISSDTSKADVNDEPSNLDKEFEKAAKDLLSIHERAVGEALNRRGIACLSKSTGSEAIKYFLSASKFKYPPASFNMGQCHELGIGTKQDFKQAADWYKVASEQGHATAMYNLGVFYAHGWGGLKADIDVAKSLFAKAAKLGQPDALAALDKEGKSKIDSHNFSGNNSGPDSFHKTSPNILITNITNGLTDDKVFQKGLGADCNWNISFSNQIAF